MIQADPAIMALLIEWIYVQDLSGADLDARQLIRLWILADRLLMPALQNEVIEYLVVQIRHHADKQARTPWESRIEETLADAEILAYVWTHTPEKSALRALLIETWPVIGNARDLERNSDRLPREMLLDFAISVVKGRSWDLDKSVADMRSLWHNPGEYYVYDPENPSGRCS